MSPKTEIPREGVEDGRRVSNSAEAFPTGPVFIEIREKGEAGEWTF